MKIIIFLLLSVIAFAQVIDKKWAIIQDLEDKIVYIDTSTLKMMNNQISVWTNIYYREPIELSPFQPKARSVRSQFLINPVTKKFQVIGSIYYDDKGTMVSESTNNRIGIANTQSNIENSPGMEVVLIKSQEFLDKGKISSEPSKVDFAAISKAKETENNKVEEPKDSVKSTEYKADYEEDFYRINKSGKVLYTSLPDVSNFQNKPDEDKTEIKFDEPESVIDSTKIILEKIETKVDETAENPTEIIIPTEPGIPTETLIPTEPIGNNDQIKPEPIVVKPEIKIEENITKAKPQISTSEYNLENEKNITNTIFSDGNLFIVQVSSWKSNSIAEKEKERLANLGYNSFIHEVFIKEKNATYRRVRIGYFSSLDEAKEMERKVK